MKRIITQEKVKTNEKRKEGKEMKKILIMAILAVTLVINVVQAQAWEAKKFGPTTVYDPTSMPLPMGKTDPVLPSII